MLYGLLFLVEMCLLVFCVLDVIRTPEDSVRHLPKLGWLVLVVLLPLAGGIAWLAVGRPQGPPRSLPYKGNAGAPRVERTGPVRAAAGSPDDDEAFLRSLQERAAAQRRAAEEQRRAAARETERDARREGEQA